MKWWLVVAALLLAGCTSSTHNPDGEAADADSSDGSSKSQPGGDEESGAATTVDGEPALQTGTASWAVPATFGCQITNEGPDAFTGITHGRLDVESFTWNNRYEATFTGAEPGVFIVVRFFDADRGPLGGSGDMPVGLYPLNNGDTISGIVPDRAAVVTFQSCASATTVEYQAGPALAITR